MGRTNLIGHARRRRLIALVTSVGLLVAGCSASDADPRAVRSEEVDDTDAPITTDSPTTTEVVEPGASTTTLPSSDVPSTVAEGVKAWTVLVYLAADNNLEAAAITDVEEMVQGVSDQMNLVVLMDRAKQGSDEAGYSSAEVPGVGDWVGAKLLNITPAGITDLGMSGDFDMTDPAVLEQFLTIGLTQYPSEHAAAVLWDHGAGWYGFSQDESLSPYNTLTADQVAFAMKNALLSAGRDKFDVVEYDACLMANLEVAATLSPIANYMIASEEVVPNHGYDYSVLGASLSSDPTAYATGIIDGFFAQSQAEHDDSSSTMSLIDLQAMPNMVNSVANFATALAANMTNDVAAFARAGAATSAFGYDPDPERDLQVRDLGQLLSTFVSTDPNVTAAQQQLEGALADAVLLHTEGSSFTGVGGLSVYLPSAPQYYRQDRFTTVSTSGPWRSLLDAFYATGGTLSDQTRFGFNPSDTQPAVTGTFDDTGITITANIAPDGIGTLASASAIYGFYVSELDTLVGIGEVPAEIIDPTTGQIGASTPAYNLVFNQGETILVAFYSVIPSPDSTVTTLSSPVVYLPPGVTDWHEGTQIYLVMSLAADGTVVQFTAVAQSPNGAYGAFTMDPAGSIQTLLPLYEPNGGFEYVSTADYSTAFGTSLPSDLTQIDIYVQTVVPSDGIFSADTPLGVGITATDVGGVTITETALVPS